MEGSQQPQINTTVALELEGRIRHAVTPMTVEQIQGKIQAEHLVPLNLDGMDIWVQPGCIEYLQEGDHRPKQQ